MRTCSPHCVASLGGTLLPSRRPCHLSVGPSGLHLGGSQDAGLGVPVMWPVASALYHLCQALRHVCTCMWVRVQVQSVCGLVREGGGVAAKLYHSSCHC